MKLLIPAEYVVFDEHKFQYLVNIPINKKCNGCGATLNKQKCEYCSRDSLYDLSA